MTTFRTHPDHAVVHFHDELSWAAVTDLVDVVDLMISGYFYRRIEIIIASPGGLTAVLDHYLTALQRWRAAGVWITTRVVSRAQSAAALVLSISDERIAEPSARLLYHHARSYTSEPLTASGTADLHDDLSRLEALHVDLLVDRAFAADPSLVADSDPCDRRVLELLGPGVHSGGARRPRSARGALRLLAHTVQRAVRTRDRALLCTVYRALFALELPISGRLARTLRLVDRVLAPPAVADFASRPPAASADPDPLSGRPGAFSESVSGDGWLQIPQWRSLFPPHGDVPRALLGRHVLALGETGSGKSVSVVLPVVRAIVQAPPDRVSASMVIDPKHEIGPMLGHLVPERLHHLRPAEDGLSLMAGPRWSLAADLAAGCWLAAATKIMLRVVSFVPSSPARVLIDHQQDTLNGEFFAREGTEFLLTVLALVLMVTKPGAPPPEDWLAGDSRACLWVRALLDRANGGSNLRGPNALALAAYALQGPLVEPPKAKPPLVFDDNPFDDSPVAQAEEWLFARIAGGALKVWGRAPGEGGDVIERVLSYWTPMVGVRPQFVGVLSSARAACSDFAESHVARTLYFGCEPGARDVGGGGCNFAEAVGPDGGGRVLLFQPSRDGLDTLLTRVLKALFFEAVFNDPIREGGGPDLPLLGYICDEFHQFVTSDRVHGEASFVDGCRSYGVFCVLACQSVASIEHAFAHSGGSTVQDRAAVSILWNDTGSKLFFRSTDPRTASRVDDLCPYRPGLSPLTQVRPLSTLSPGECYAVLADGRFERRQLDPVLPRAVKRVPALRLVPPSPDLQP